jgi:hypothetical protein
MEPTQPSAPLGLFQTRFFRAIQESLPAVSFSLYRRFLRRAGQKEFCNLLLRALMSTISSGMSSRHSLRAAELGGCLIAYCGGKELVSVLFSKCLPLCDMLQSKTVFYGQLVAYLAITAAVLTGIHLLPDQAPSSW